MRGVVSALLWGLAGGSTLVVGSLVGCFVRLPRQLVAGLMAIGAGVLVSSVAYELVGEVAEETTLEHMAAGMAFGSLAFFAGDLAVSRRGAASRKMSAMPQTGTAAAGTALAIGALLDGVPESAAIGALLHGATPSVAFVAAVALSNLPEGLSSSVAMRRQGHGIGYVLGVWGGIAVASGIAAAVGHAALGGASAGTIAFVMAFAAGAVLTMLASTMLPEAARDGGPVIGLLTTAGFLAAVLLDRM
jgi:zinc transporter, ZIP family